MVGPLFGLLSSPQQSRAQENKKLGLRKLYPAFPPPTSVPVQGLRCHPGSPRSVLSWYPGPLLPPMAPKLLSSRLPWKSVSFRSESLTRPVSGVTVEGCGGQSRESRGRSSALLLETRAAPRQPLYPRPAASPRPSDSGPAPARIP